MNSTLYSLIGLAAGVAFILALKGLSHPKTARRGNLIGAFGATVATLAVSNLLNVTTSTSKFNEAYPSVVCPPTIKTLASQVSVASPNTKIHRVGSTSAKFVKSRALRFPIPADPILVDAQGVTPIVWQSRPGSWAGGTICSDPAASQWFVGGSADITARGKLILVNSGLSESVADVYVWSGATPTTSKAISVKANSFESIPFFFN